jgi:hypothetical protein
MGAVMSTFNQRIAPPSTLATRLSRARGETKIRRIVQPVDRQPRQSAVSSALQRPDSTILSAAIPIFAIGRSKDGMRIACDCDGPGCCAFWFKRSAVRFAKRSSPGCALMFVQGKIDSPAIPSTRIGAAIKQKIAKLIATIRSRSANPSRTRS